MNSRNRITILLLQAAPYLLFLVILLVFGSLSDRFLAWRTSPTSSSRQRLWRFSPSA
jgi:hypothetical protein